MKIHQVENTESKTDSVNLTDEEKQELSKKESV